MKLIELTEQDVFYEDTKHKDFGRFACGWTRDEFAQQFAIAIPENLFSLTYEPSRELYVYAIDTPDNCFSIKNVSEYAVMAHLKSRLAVVASAAITKEFPDHTFDIDTDSWIITDIRQAEMDEVIRTDTLILDEMFKLAIDSLKSKGDLPSNYVKKNKK
jgi:hypothetical protein